MSENTIPKRTFKEDKIDFNKILTKYKRYWWLFAASCIICISLGVLYLYIKKPVYFITAKVLISQDEDGSSMGAAIIKNLSLGGGGSKVDDEIVVLNSQSIRKEMVRQLKLNRSYSEKVGFLQRRDLYNNSPVVINAPDELFDTLMSSLKFKIEINGEGNDINIKVTKGRFRTLAEVNAKKFPVLVKTEYGMYSIDTTKFYKAGSPLDITAVVTGNLLMAENYETYLTVGLISKKSNGIFLNVDETNIKRGKDVLNKIIELYNVRGQDEKNEMAVNTAKFLNERLNIIYKELSVSESDIEQYKKNRNFTDLGAEAGYLMSQKGTLEANIFQLETEYSITKMIKEFLSDAKNKYSLVPSVPELGGASKGIEEYNTLLLQKMNLENNAKENNVVLKTLKEQIDAMRANLITSIEKAMESTKIKLADLRSKNLESKSKLKDIPTQEREFVELRRQQGIKNELYNFLLQKREENELVLAATTPKGKIVDDAFAYSESIAPKKSMVFALSIFFGIIIPLLILYIKNLINTKFTTLDELEELVSVPVLGEICHNKSSESTVVKKDRTTSIVELFRLVRNNVQFMLPSKDDKVILITSSVSGEGKSFISVNLAASFALLGKKVVLVGMDIRSPKLAEYLSLKKVPGVTTYLSQPDTKIDDLIQKYETDGLDIIVAGPVPPNPSELLLSKRVDEMFEELNSRYDYIIIDSAPIAMVSDTFSLLSYCKMLIYVTRANYTQRGNLKYFNSIIKKGQIHNAAVLLNDSNPKLSHGYGYGYGKKDLDN